MKLFTRRAPEPILEPRAYIERIERSRVVVHTTAGSSIEGILTHVYLDCIVLEHAAYLSGAGRNAIDGEAVIEQAKVDWLQRLGPGKEA